MEQKFKKENVENNVAKSVNKRSSVSKKKKKNNSIFMLILGSILGIAVGVMIAVIVLNNGTEKRGKDVNESTSNQQTEGSNTLDELLEAEGSTIKTPIVNLYFPKKWEKQIRTEQIEGDVHTVQFYGKVEEKDEVHLFDIIFGEAEGILLGTINETEVFLVYSDIEFNDSWSEAEQNEIYSMQEDVNYIIGMLQKEKGFKSAN